MLAGPGHRNKLPLSRSLRRHRAILLAARRRMGHTPRAPVLAFSGTVFGWLSWLSGLSRLNGRLGSLRGPLDPLVAGHRLQGLFPSNTPTLRALLAKVLEDIGRQLLGHARILTGSRLDRLPNGLLSKGG